MTDINITDEEFYTLIREECEALADLLIAKNKNYGNSILRSPNVFSTTTPLDKIADRLDDKLSRVMSGRENDPEDAKHDIAGYLVLDRVVRRLMGEDMDGVAATSEPKAVAKPVKKRKTKAKAEKPVPVATPLEEETKNQIEEHMTEVFSEPTDLDLDLSDSAEVTEDEMLNLL